MIDSPSSSAKFSLTPLERTTSWWFLRTYSITYASATRLFPREIRDQVAVIYAWVRLADELVDNPRGSQTPEAALNQFRKSFEQAWENGAAMTVSQHSHLAATTSATTGAAPSSTTLLARTQSVHDTFVRLAQHLGIERSWCEAFLDSMAMDLEQKTFTQAELDRYVYGSAEVIGLMMARVMRVHNHDDAARALGRWMQIVNFLRDVGEDVTLRERVYFPTEILAKHGLTIAELNPALPTKRFNALMLQSIADLTPIHDEAVQGIGALPLRFRFAIELATRLYEWSLEEIAKDPSQVWQRQLKPSKWVIAWTISQLVWDHARQIGTRADYTPQSPLG